MARARTAKSHPQDIHETHDVKVGWEHFGIVGRFKRGKTWFFATKQHPVRQRTIACAHFSGQREIVERDNADLWPSVPAAAGFFCRVGEKVTMDSTVHKGTKTFFPETIENAMPC